MPDPRQQKRNSNYQNAFKAWASIKKKIEDYKLLTETQVAALKIKQKRWKDDKDEVLARMKLVGETQSKIEKLTNARGGGSYLEKSRNKVGPD